MRNGNIPNLDLNNIRLGDLLGSKGLINRTRFSPL